MHSTCRARRCAGPVDDAGLWPWSQLLRRLLGDRPALPDGLGDRRRWIDLVVGGSASTGGEGGDDPDTTRLEVADALVDLLRAAGRDGVGLLVIDDLRWADAPSLRLPGAVAPALRSIPILLAVAYRDTDVTAGQAYYARPGHLPLMFADTEIVEFSPSDQLAPTMETVLRNLAAAGA